MWGVNQTWAVTSCHIPSNARAKGLVSGLTDLEMAKVDQCFG